MINMGLHEAELDALRRARMQQAQELAGAVMADFAALRYRIGRIRGLDDAIEIVEDTLSRMLEG